MLEFENVMSIPNNIIFYTSMVHKMSRYEKKSLMSNNEHLAEHFHHKIVILTIKIIGYIFVV